jgi:hypothetical protein
MAAGSNGGGAPDAPLSNLSEIERRTLANLSIPRNPHDIVTRLHGFVSLAEPEGEGSAPAAGHRATSTRFSAATSPTAAGS